MSVSCRKVVAFLLIVFSSWAPCSRSVAQTLDKTGSGFKPVEGAAERMLAIAEFQRRMRTLYVDPVIGERVAAALEAAAPRLTAIGSPARFARSFTRVVQRVSKDRHLALSYAGPTSNSDRRQSDKSENRNQRRDVKAVQLLAGNVAYLRVDGFARLSESRADLECAFRLVSKANALVLDLSNNGGGNPDTVAFVSGYLLGPDKEIVRLLDRQGTVVTRLRSADTAFTFSGPVEVIVSRHTFSAGEGLAFILQQQHRAEIIGERTPGATNPGRFESITPHFQVFIPETRVLEAKSERDWREGVIPDVKAGYRNRVAVALRRARSVLKNKTAQTAR